MEDYEDFVASRLSLLRERTAGSPSAPGRHGGHRSLIRFYGQSILPPLLSGEQREEMLRLKDHLRKPAGPSSSAAGGRVAHVQHMLHSVQLRKVPTLQEFFQEKSGLHILSDSNVTSNTSSPHSVHGSDTKDHLSFSPSPCPQDGNTGPKVSPLTSTTYSEISRHHPKPPQHQAGCFFDENEECPHSQPIIDPVVDISHQSQSSGYVTYDNAENATSVFARVESARESCLFGTVAGGKYSGGFFLCNPSNMTAKMPDIISHPPIDGEKLERSAIDSSIDDCLIANDMLTEACGADSPQKQSVICSLSAESGPTDEDLVACRPLGNAQETLHEMKQTSARCDTFDQDENASGRDCPVPPMEVGTASSPASATDHCTTTTNRPQVQGSSRERDTAEVLNHDTEKTRFEEPYRLSLQALLKKSQECRQQQRILRNQARNSRVILERAQEQHRDREQEHNLSDKENEEFPHKATERRKTKQKSGYIENQAVNKLCENEQKLSKVEDLPLKGSNDELTTLHNTVDLNLTGNANTETLDVGANKTLPENNPHVFSPKSAKESPTKPVEVFAQTPTDISAHSPAHFSPPSTESTIRSLSHSKSGRSYHVVPIPQLCTSPVHCKSKGLNKTGGSNGTSRDPTTMVLVKTAQNAVGMFETEAAQDGHKNTQRNVAFPVAHLVDEVDSARALSRSSVHTQHIDQLELNLSSLKLLISELESTITENMKNQSQPENAGPVDPNDSYNGDKSLYGAWSPAEDSAWQRRQLLDHYRDNDEDTDPELSDFIDLPPIRPHKGGDAMGENKGSTVNALATVRGQKNSAVFSGGRPLLLGGGGSGGGGTSKNRVQGTDRAPLARGIVAMSCREHAGSRKPQPSAKRITSLTQRMLIPDVFREIPLNTSLPVKVLLDTGNQPAKKGPQAVIEEGGSSCSVSLNHSYDVERPSGLWLLDCSGSELGSHGPHVPENKHLTPESGGEGGEGGQVGVSKAKRRLLMHAKKEAEERSWDSDRGAGPLVRPHEYASTPKASPQKHGDRVGQGDEQQLKRIHAAQWKALQEEQGRQQQQLLQALAERYHLLQRMSSLCPPSVSHPGDTATLSVGVGGGGGGGGGELSDVCFQPVEQSLPERYRPLVAAAVKGFLTRRLLRTDRVEQLRRTAKDTQQFLQAFEQQSPGRGELCSRQDMLLWERVTLQLRSARYELHDVCFSLSAAERMQLISWDRELARDRELKQQQATAESHRTPAGATDQKWTEAKRRQTDSTAQARPTSDNQTSEGRQDRHFL
ncbi:Centriolar coiled-coil protein [Merluccius polli]|uniref:Centriolar coiled-coil protein n=1 Tax=Merluccius polli TaxID=89951 RepID=A0AA47N6W5_MERPO|nr:Centriolar coiled-coil protein [Merluccius polli]